MSPEELVRDLSTLGIAHEVRRSGADGAILVLPEYGRVLGMWPHLKADNALWVNPDFLRSLQVGIKDDEWTSPGGDRLWLAPAEEFLQEGRAAPSVDPGKYTLSADRASLLLFNQGEAFALRTEAVIRFRLSRRIRPLFEPDIDSLFGRTWLRRAGWDEELELQVEGPCSVPMQLWSVAEAPPGSEPLAVSRCLACIEDAESDRARLLLKAVSNGSASIREPGAGRMKAVEMSFLSPPMGGGAKGRLKWKTTTCSFSGRSAEVRQFASRMLYSFH